MSGPVFGQVTVCRHCKGKGTGTHLTGHCYWCNGTGLLDIKYGEPEPEVSPLRQEVPGEVPDRDGVPVRLNRRQAHVLAKLLDRQWHDFGPEHQGALLDLADIGATFQVRRLAMGVEEYRLVGDWPPKGET